MTKFHTSMIFVSAAAISLVGVPAQAATTTNAIATAAQAATVQPAIDGEEILVNGRSFTFCTREEMRGSYADRKACLSPERSRQLLRR